MHPSNYRVEGFSESVSYAALAELAATADVPLIADLYSRRLSSILGIALIGLGILIEGLLRLEGHLSAEVTQACVVSLEPVASRIEADFAVDYSLEPAPACSV